MQNNAAIKTQRSRAQNQAQPSNYDHMKTKKDLFKQYNSDQVIQINGVKIKQPSESMNLFVQSMLDANMKHLSGTTRLEKDVEDMLRTFRRNPDDQESDLVHSPMKTQKIAQGNYSPQAYILLVQNKHFIRTYDSLREKLLANIQPNKSLFTHQKWNQIIEPLAETQVYLTIKERLQLIKNIYYLIKVEFGIPFTQKQQEIHLLTQKYPLNQFSFCEQIAYELSKLKTKIMNRKTQTLKVLALMESFSDIKMDFTELSNSTEWTNSQNDKDKKIDEKAFELCKSDIYAFSFVTLYLANCINLQLQKKPEQVFDLIQKLKGILKTLSKKYPPNSADIPYDGYDQQQVELIIDDSFKKGNMYVPPIKLKKALSIQEKVSMIQSQIIKKARIAKSNKVRFDDVLKPICQKLGKGYQSGLKIRTDSIDDRLTRARVFEKIVFKKDSQGLTKFEKEFEKDKGMLVQNLIKNANTFNKILAFNEYCFAEFNDLRNEYVLKNKEQVPFEVFDLLRAKAVFDKPSDIIRTANDIYKKFEEIRSGYYNLVQYDNRLNEKTKDFQLNFLINGTISELQLALKLDKSANEFNHKLYELQRSKNLTALITLQTVNDQLAEKYFIDQLQLCYVVKESDGKKNGLLKDSVKLKEFEKLLSMNVTKGDEGGKSLHDLVFSEDRQKQQMAIDQYLYMANSFVTGKEQNKYNKDLNFQRESLRKANNQLCVKEMKH